jgi:hypothetical protein
MRLNHLQPFVIGQFLAALKDRGTVLSCPQSNRPVLYLKCWGSDYPYLQGREKQNRWLPVVVKSQPSI